MTDAITSDVCTASSDWVCRGCYDALSRAENATREQYLAAELRARGRTDVVTLLEDERDKLRAERRQLRTRLVECLPFVGVCPLQPNRIQLMLLVRGLADDTLEEVKP